MASALALSLHPFPSSLQRNPNFIQLRTRRRVLRRNRRSVMASASDLSQKPTKLVTFLGKGGSGKTTAAIIAAQYYAKAGLRTCLVIHSQDPTAEYLIGRKIGSSPTICNSNFSAVRLETTKMLLEPLNRLKKADARINLTQGVLEGVVGEELGVLPGMDSIFSALALEKFIGFLGGTVRKKRQLQEKFDIVVYDGISNEETLRMIGAAERARWYLKHLRALSGKTDIGRLTAPSILKLADESIGINGGSGVNGRNSAEIWDDAERILEKASAAFTDPSKFSCYLVMDPNSSTSVIYALRYWGCAIQAGTQISGAFGFTPKSCIESSEVSKKTIAPLPFALMPYLSTHPSVDWDMALKDLREDARNLLHSENSTFKSLVKFDSTKKSVTLFMPGFDKSEIKLYQYRGGSELLVEAGDQRRVIRLPSGIQGKVGGAKFTDRSLVITLR